VSKPFFTDVPDRIPFGGPDATDPLAFSVYEPDRLVLGKRMEDHLRIGACLWHSFAWPG
jgi:xylose isomerase